MDAIFFPRKDYDVEICEHRLGKQMTYTEQTDGLYLGYSYSQFMALAKAKNIKVGCFAEYEDFSNALFYLAKQDSDNGKIWIDQYSRCPSLATKIMNHDVITEQEFETAYITELFPVFNNAMGRKPVSLSYSYNNDSFKDYVIERYLGARNSDYNGNTDYGVGCGSPSNEPYSKSRFKSKSGTTRWYDYAKTHGGDYAGQIAVQGALIDSTLQNGGWINNFTHWHNYWEDGNEEWVDTYLSMLATKNTNGQIYFAGYGEAVAYIVYRQLITRAVMYSPKANPSTQLFIRLEAENTLGIDDNLLQVPISIKFSTNGTPLAGKTVTSDCNLISLSSGDYIVEIPYTGRFPYAIINEV